MVFARRASHRILLTALVAMIGTLTNERVRAEPLKPVYDKAQQFKDDALNFLGRLVSVDSGTGDEHGVNGVGALVTEELKKLETRVEISPAKPAAGDNIVATLTGSGKVKILLIAHMDTVFAPGTVDARPFRVTNGRAYGPGVNDDKGGIVTGIYALKILRDLNFKNYGQITLLLNTNEETGSVGARALIEKLAKEHDVTLNLEPGRPADGLVIWRKGSARAMVEVKGKTAHAGVAPDSGRNAAMELAYQILQLSNLAIERKARRSTSRCSTLAIAPMSFLIMQSPKGTFVPRLRRNSIESSGNLLLWRRRSSFPTRWSQRP